MGVITILMNHKKRKMLCMIHLNHKSIALSTDIQGLKIETDSGSHEHPIMC